MICPTCGKELIGGWLEVAVMNGKVLEKQIKVCNADCIPESDSIKLIKEEK